MYYTYKLLCIYLMINIETTVGKDQMLESWTSCEEFLQNTTLNYTHLVDVDWKIFFFWNREKNIRPYHFKFSLADPILVGRFESELKDKDPTINWSRAVLYLETSTDFSAMCIETDASSKLRIIPSIAFDLKTVPKIIFGLKLVEPGYLGIMNCDRHVCYALAPVDKMPADDELYSAAQRLGLSSIYNRTYLTHIPQPLSTFEDDDEPEYGVDNDEL